MKTRIVIFLAIIGTGLFFNSCQKTPLEEELQAVQSTAEVTTTSSFQLQKGVPVDESIFQDIDTEVNSRSGGQGDCDCRFRFDGFNSSPVPSTFTFRAYEAATTNMLCSVVNPVVGQWYPFSVLDNTEWAVGLFALGFDTQYGLTVDCGNGQVAASSSAKISVPARFTPQCPDCDCEFRILNVEAQSTFGGNPVWSIEPPGNPAEGEINQSSPFSSLPIGLDAPGQYDVRLSTVLTNLDVTYEIDCGGTTVVEQVITSAVEEVRTYDLDENCNFIVEPEDCNCSVEVFEVKYVHLGEVSGSEIIIPEVTGTWSMDTPSPGNPNLTGTPGNVPQTDLFDIVPGNTFTIRASANLSHPDADVYIRYRINCGVNTYTPRIAYFRANTQYEATFSVNDNCFVEENFTFF